MSAHLRAPGDSHEIAEAIRDHLQVMAGLLDGAGHINEARQARYLSGLAFAVPWAPAGAGEVRRAEQRSALAALDLFRIGMSTRELVLATGLPATDIVSELRSSPHVVQRGEIWSISAGRDP